jgi:hypothetical protein
LERPSVPKCDEIPCFSNRVGHKIGTIFRRLPTLRCRDGSGCSGTPAPISLPRVSSRTLPGHPMSQHHASVTCEERDRLMDLYLAAAFKVEEINKPQNEPPSADWLPVVKQAHRDCRIALEISRPTGRNTAARGNGTELSGKVSYLGPRVPLRPTLLRVRDTASPVASLVRKT